MGRGLSGTLLDEFPLGVALVGAEAQVLEVNPALARLAGVAAPDLLGEGLYLRAFPSEAAGQRLKSKALGALEAPFDDLDLSPRPSPDADRRQLMISGGPVAVEPGPRALLIFHDVTHRRAFERVFEASFDNFIQVTNALDEALKKIGEQNAVLEEYKTRMTRELAVARSVQRALVPRDAPRLPGFDLCGEALPTDELGGDCLAWYDLGEGDWGLLIADVSGHGVPSSLVSTLLKALFDEHVRRTRDPGEVLTQVNRDLAAALGDTGFFATAWYGVVNRFTRHLAVAVAGHEAAWCLAGASVTRLGADETGTILGAFPDSVYTTTTHSLDPGAEVLACTDGIVEARDRAGAFFGAEGLEAVLRAEGGRSARQTVEAVLSATDRHFAGALPNDDRALWVLRLPGDETLEALRRRARDAFRDRHFDQVVALVQLVVAGRQAEAGDHLILGQAWAHLGRLDEAQTALGTAAEADPGSVKAWYFLGLTRHNAGDRPGARQAWLRVQALDPGYKDIQTLLQRSER